LPINTSSGKRRNVAAWLKIMRAHEFIKDICARIILNILLCTPMGPSVFQI